MGTISQTIRLEDKMSPVFAKISKNAQEVLKVFNHLDTEQTKLTQAMALVAHDYGTQNKLYKELAKGARAYGDELSKLVKTGSINNETSWMNNNKWYQQWKENQQNITKEVDQTALAFNRLKGIMKTVIGVYSIKQLMNMSDQLVQTEARLGLMSMDGESIERLSDRVYLAAQRSRADYNTMASTVAKLGMQAGDNFSSNAEIVKFAENLNKIFVTSGLDAGGIQSVMYNLTQSMSTGRLLGNDYRILKMNAPELVKMLKQTYANGSQAALDEMVSKGQISAQMLKNAIIGATNEIEEKFNKMPVTWEQVFTSIKNSTQRLMKPVLKIVSQLAGKLYELTTFIEQNWKKLSPIFAGILAFFAALAASYVISKIQNIALTISLSASAAAYIAQANAAMAAGQAVDFQAYAAAKGAAANATLAATLGKVALVAAVAVATSVAASWAIEKLTGESLDAAGILVGAVGMVVGAIIEPMKPIWNMWLFLVNSIVGVFTDGMNGLKNAWLGFLITLLEGIETAAKEIDRVASTSFAGDQQGGLHRQILEMKSEREILQSGLNWKGIDYFEPKGISEWTKEGYFIGEGFSKTFDLSAEDIESSIQNALDGVTTASGSAIRTTLSDEDIQLLMDVATRDYKLAYQQITPEIQLTFGDIRETADVEGIIENITEQIESAYDRDLREVAVT